MHMYTSLKMLLKRCIHVHIASVLLEYSHYQHLSSNVSISSINAESILQIVVSRIKCLYFKTFCRFFFLCRFLLTVLWSCISHSLVPCQACSVSSVSLAVLLCELFFPLYVYIHIISIHPRLFSTRHGFMLAILCYGIDLFQCDLSIAV